MTPITLGSYRAFIFDLDGCVYRGEEIIQGASEVVTRLRAMDKRILFLTNNATKSPEEYMAKLDRLGIKVSLQEILTSGTATAIYLSNNFGSARVFPVGGRALVRELKRAGHRVVSVKEISKADFVVACLDFRFTYLKMSLATKAIFSGARFIATNVDPTLPVEGGMMPGAGAIASAISAATGKEPLVIGKPSPYMVDIAADRLEVAPKDMVFIGDRLDTDIRVGKRAGSFTILVLSGSTTKEEAFQIKDPELKPDLILPDVSHMRDHL